MKKAAVIINEWKLSIFKKHLDDAGYEYTQFRGVTKGTLTLQVQYGWVADLKPVIEAANAECASKAKP